MAIYNFKKDAKVYVYPTINIERGLTVSETHAPTVEIDGLDGTAFGGTPRNQKVFMAGDVVLPSTFALSVECLFEHGGSGSGTWIGVTTDAGVKNFHFRTGNGATGAENQVQDTSRVYQKIPISQIPEFDDKVHTVAWELDPVGNTAKFWIDNRLVISESVSGLGEWSGGDDGAWLKGYDSIAGFGTGVSATAYKTQWSGAAASDLRVYSNQALTYTNTPIELDVTENLSFSQTFTDKTYPQRTLHNLNHFHEASNIKTANTANFEFTIPALVENDLKAVFDLLIDYDESGHNLNTFDLYIKLPNDVYRLENCVITNGTFIIEKLENLKLGIRGQASKLTRGQTFPGNVQARSSTRTFQRMDYLSVSFDDAPVTGLFKVSIELQNSVAWTAHETINDAVNVTNAATSMYPSNFTLEKRILSGSLGQYITNENNSTVQTWETGVTIVIKAGEDESKGFQFNLPDCTFTNRNNIDEVFTQNYDWKMNNNPADLGSLIKFNTN